MTGTSACPAGMTCWQGCPSATANTVRSASCRATTSLSAAVSAAVSSLPRSRHANGRLYAVPGPWNCSRNHSRCCANDSGTRSGRGTRTSGGRAAPAPSSTWARPAGVGFSNTARTASSTPSTTRTRDTSRVASSECPPRSKKLSSTPTRSTPRTCPNTSHRARSRAVAGARPPPAAAYSGAGSARRSSFPLGDSGSASSITTAAGTIYPGSTRPAAARNPAGSSTAPAAGTTYPASRRSPGRSSRTATAACTTPGSPASTASTSPSSIRNPRIFTWSSVRPRYSSWPSAVHRTRSPVRYIRCPAPPNGHATNRSAVSPGRPRYPRASPAPARYSSPATPGGTSPSPASSTNTRVFQIGRPIIGTWSAPPPELHDVT